MAGLKQFKRVSGATEEVAKLQTRLNEFFTQFIDNPLLDGVHLTGVQLTELAVNVDHKLGRECQGWIITNKNTAADIWQVGTGKSYITLQASIVDPMLETVTIDLWVF